LSDRPTIEELIEVQQEFGLPDTALVEKDWFNPAEVALLALEIMPADAEAYGHQFPAYRANPVAETLRAVAGLAADPDFASRYAIFQRDMVYGETVDFKTAVTALVALATQVKMASVP
jgi:hypothetical protein